MDKRASLLTWAAFLITCFCVVGLMGLFASYAGQIPLERAIARLGVLDEVATAARAPNPAEALGQLRPKLADRAGPVLDGPGALDERIAGERRVALRDGVAEAEAVAARVRLLLLLVTLMAGGFGVGVLAMSRRG